MRIAVRLEEKATGNRVDATIRPMQLGDLFCWMEWPYSKRDEDLDWNWIDIFRETIRDDKNYESYSLVVDKSLHGLMALDLFDPIAQENEALLLDYLATNPEDRFSADEGFKYIGLSLVAAAVIRSKNCGLQGRLYLKSLPGAEKFYERLFFERQEAVSKEGYTTYFLTSIMADKILDCVKQEGIISL